MFLCVCVLWTSKGKKEDEVMLSLCVSALWIGSQTLQSLVISVSLSAKMYCSASILNLLIYQTFDRWWEHRRCTTHEKKNIHMFKLEPAVIYAFFPEMKDRMTVANATFLSLDGVTALLTHGGMVTTTAVVANPLDLCESRGKDLKCSCTRTDDGDAFELLDCESLQAEHIDWTVAPGGVSLWWMKSMILIWLPTCSVGGT